MKSFPWIKSIILFACLFYAEVSFANTSKATLSIIAEKRELLKEQKNWLGLYFIIEKGWHIYWKNPGDSGLAPQIEWKKQDGVEISALEWPYPKRISANQIISYAYEEKVLIPFSIKISKSFQKNTLNLSGTASWLVCEKICISEEAPISLTIAISSKKSSLASGWGKLFQDTRLLIPKKIENDFYSISKNKKIIQLQLKENFLKTYSKEIIDVFPLSLSVKNNPLPEIKNINKGINITFELNNYIPDKEEFAFVLIANKNSTHKAFEVKSSLLTKIKETKQKLNLYLLLKYIFFAFIGGLLLNLMPCVFPILSLKILSFINHKEEKTYISGLFYTLGVLSFCLIVASLFLLLRLQGEEIGWGFQLQSPIFVLLLIILFFFIVLNLLGAYEFSGKFSSWGDKFTHGNTKFSSFATGALAVLVATPCSAPFMGIAIGFSLTQSPPVAMFIFASLGLGLAFPYALLSCFPTLSSYFPKPGAWMLSLKEFLAFPILLTVAWLIWIFTLQKGATALLYVLVSIILIYFACWIEKNLRKSKVVLLPLTLILAALGFSASITTKNSEKTSLDLLSKKERDTFWEPFSTQVLENYLINGEKVFVNFTAAWCITCKINERNVLNKKEIQLAFIENNIKTLKADWTKKNEEISKIIHKYNRAGIPLYLFFNGKDKNPIILPQLLQVKNLLKLIQNSKD